MNTKTAEMIAKMTSAELRGYAKQIGVTRKSDDTKMTLAARVIAALEAKAATPVEVVEVTPIEATTEETLALLAEVAEDTRPAQRPGFCTICRIRRIGTGKGTDPKHAKTMGYCAPCLEEAEWENEHSDRGHEDANGETDAACWICHPELNHAAKGARVAVSGRSRAGMVIFAKGTYLHKSALVAEAIKATGGTATVKATKNGERTDLTGEVAGVTIAMGWDGNAFAYGARSVIDGKQVRNVAAALRIIAGLAAKK